jgi:class 3 adenylate cyclase
VIHDEPVRGSVPPPWFWSLSGFERMRALGDGLLPSPPLSRLTGLRMSHVDAGSTTWTMPASDWLVGYGGLLDLTILIESALTGAALTTAPPGSTVTPVTMSINHFRVPRAARGNAIAHARVVHSSSLFAFTEVRVQDPDGRPLAQGYSQAAIVPVTPPPPPRPASLQRVEEPTYATPDPYLRQAAATVAWQQAVVAEGANGVETLRAFIEAESRAPLADLAGLRDAFIEEGAVGASIPASEWFCGVTRHVSPGAVATLANMAGWMGAVTVNPPGHWMAGLDLVVRFHAPALPDGRNLRGTASGVMSGSGNIVVAPVEVVDADDRLLLSGSVTGVFVDAARRVARSTAKAERVLTTILVTDIVGSTGHADRLGDESWRELLDRHNEVVRRAIASHDGTEVKTTGDGFQVRFDSPTEAVRCALAACDAVRQLGLEIRAGVHTGEVELHDRELAGLAVHIAARLEGQAEPGEVVVSGTVKDLAIGSGLSFEDRGERELKGIPGTWHVYAVRA